MKIAVLKEQNKLEARVAVTPDSVKKYIKLGLSVSVEKGAGEKSSFTDKAYKDVGATVAATTKAAVDKADIVLSINPITADQLSLLSKGTTLISDMQAFDSAAAIKKYAAAGIQSFAMELMPRITKAQSLDILSSQSNLAGYRAVMEASTIFNRAFPLMMTAAGTVAPAKVLVIGAGVAGLQAIATAKRLGAVVNAFDVRPETKEQVESLGATFVEVDSDESGSTEAGYAKEMSADYKKRQAAKMAEVMTETDICISTALIPGKPAPEIITEKMVKDMPEGSVIIDMAASRGGNCKLTEKDKVVVKHGVHLVGYTDLASRVAGDASNLFARNLFNFVKEMYNTETKKLALDWQDPIFRETCLTYDGKAVNERFGGTPVEPLQTEEKVQKAA